MNWSILLNNRTYIGEAVHKGTSYLGEHQPIITQGRRRKVRRFFARANGQPKPSGFTETGLRG